ncbi:MAG: HAD-IB family phosphatase [Chitinispirillaceae bacterium]|nr:HAD-IB family phosphatase [Chitinispirillaceae bacterium]
MISIIIPVLDEEATIGKVVRFCKSASSVDEVIVVDDKSIDATAKEAQAAGATVITSTKMGKGASMCDGFLLSKNEVVVFLDGDIDYQEGTIGKLTAPLLEDRADFVKSTFSRQAGRVTELVAKPLISMLYPDLAGFHQPLSGIIATKRGFFEKLKLENDYGVDIGILIDMWNMKARIVEVDIGFIQNKMKIWRELGSMSHDVSRAILKRVTNASLVNLDSLGEINLIRDQMEFAIKETLQELEKMIIFDMDNTILLGRFIEVAAREAGFHKELVEIVTKNQEPYLIAKLIAQLMKGMDLARIIRIADSIPMVEDTVEVIQELKHRGYIVGIISDSYDVVVNRIKVKIGADFALANELEFSQSVATGEVKIPSFFLKTEQSLCNHNYCKSNALRHLSNKYLIPLSNIVAIGDSAPDICIVKYAGVGVAFCSSNGILNSIADQKIEEKSFAKLLEFAL